MTRLVRIVFVLAMWALPNVAAAYDRAGHFYSIDLLVHVMGIGVDDPSLELIAFCSQLPDETAELDAMDTVRHWGTVWHTFGFTDDDAARMLQTHALLHGLTGTASSDMTAAARRTADELIEISRKNPTDPAALCAVGFAFHLLGDTYAHRVLRNETILYGPVWGHAFDTTTPDDPLYNLFDGYTFCSNVPFVCPLRPATRHRLDNWAQYLGTALGDQAEKQTEALKKIVMEVTDSSKRSNDKTSPQQVMRRVLAAGFTQDERLGIQRERRMDAFFLGVKHGLLKNLPPCEAVVACAINLDLIKDAPRCAAAWDIFKRAAWQQFGPRVLDASVLEVNPEFGEPEAVTPERLAQCPRVPPRPRSMIAMMRPVELSGKSPEDIWKPPPLPELVFEPESATRGPKPADDTTKADPKADTKTEVKPTADKSEPPGPKPPRQALTSRSREATCDDTTDKWTPPVDQGMSAAVYFATNDHTLDAAQVDWLMGWLARSGWAQGEALTATGYADKRGTNEHNDELSRERAEEVKSALIKKGVPQKGITTNWSGSASPPCAEKTPECFCRSRRVIINVVRPR